MSSCPNCRHRIGLKAMLQPASLTGTICPHCRANLRTERWASALLTLVSLGAGLLAGNFVRKSGAAFPLDLAALLVAFAVVYVALAPVLLRFRMKQGSATQPGR